MATGSQGVSDLAQRVSGWFSDHQAIAWWTNVLRLACFNWAWELHWHRSPARSTVC